MTVRIPVTPDTAVSGWALHELDMPAAQACGDHGGPYLRAAVLGQPRLLGSVPVYPANGIRAVGVERAEDGWCWIVSEGDR